MDILEELKQQCDLTGSKISYVVLHKAVEEIKTLRAQLTSQKEQAETVDEPQTLLEDWLKVNMPSGTEINDPMWWAKRIRIILNYEKAQLTTAKPSTNSDDKDAERYRYIRDHECHLPDTKHYRQRHLDKIIDAAINSERG